MDNPFQHYPTLFQHARSRSLLRPPRICPPAHPRLLQTRRFAFPRIHCQPRRTWISVAMSPGRRRCRSDSCIVDACRWRTGSTGSRGWPWACRPRRRTGSDLDHSPAGAGGDIHLRSRPRPVLSPSPRRRPQRVLDPPYCSRGSLSGTRLRNLAWPHSQAPARSAGS